MVSAYWLVKQAQASLVLRLKLKWSGETPLDSPYLEAVILVYSGAAERWGILGLNPSVGWLKFLSPPQANFQDCKQEIVRISQEWRYTPWAQSEQVVCAAQRGDSLPIPLLLSNFQVSLALARLQGMANQDIHDHPYQSPWWEIMKTAENQLSGLLVVANRGIKSFFAAPL